MKPQQLQTRDLFGLRVTAAVMADALDIVDAAIQSRQRLRIGVVNAAKIVALRQDRDLRNDIISSDLILADGMSVVWASRLLGRPLPERLAGIDLMLGMLERGSRLGYRLFCLGGTEAVCAATVRNIRRDFPGVEIVGHHHGYFNPDEEWAIVESIAAARPDILLVAMSSPRKERFMARWSGQFDAPVLHGVGGAFDVLAGQVHRAPRGWQALGLEWLYRLGQEPRRLWRRYLVSNPVFCLMVLTEMVRPRRRVAAR
jgi:N-acetylglucosaminyldiphosphoundecaprenol N-acetyl-beta-D-mannosaminyltransferase